jgi:hypothetical protein
MKVTFTYDKEKDIWCLLNYGKKSGNSGLTTKAYDQFISIYGEDFSEENASEFIDKYITENNIDIDGFISDYQKDWGKVSVEYTKRAEDLFGVSLPHDVTAYLTINNRCPYSLENNNFFVSMSNRESIRKTTAMHELWHFYTWYAFGSQEEALGKQKYNDLKESLTVLLNVEFKHLLPEDVEDKGYPQHQEIRAKILEFWAKDKNMSNLWEYLVSEC